MWKAIRLHPWRLEIVPAAAFALTVWSVYVYETRVAWVVRRIPELRHSGLGALPWLLLGMVSAFWFVEFGHNQFWVLSERRKRFNAYVLVIQCAVITHAWFAYSFTSVFLAMLHHHAARPAIPVPLLLAFIVTGTGITALLEWSRKYVAREEPPEPPLPAEAANAPCYRERALDWWYLSSSLILLVFTLTVMALAIAARDTGLIAGMAAAICGVVVVATLGCNVLIVTPTAVSHWFGLFRIRVPIADMESCVLGDPEPGRRPRGVKMTSRCKRGERRVEIRMTNGRVYRLGALRPSHICELIGKPASQVEPEADS